MSRISSFRHLLAVLAVVPCAALLVGCPDEEKKGEASDAVAAPSAPPATTASATLPSVVTATEPAGQPPADAGAAPSDAGKDARATAKH